jgi:hypothetical protein
MQPPTPEETARAAELFEQWRPWLPDARQRFEKATRQVWAWPE